MPSGCASAARRLVDPAHLADPHRCRLAARGTAQRGAGGEHRRVRAGVPPDRDDRLPQPRVRPGAARTCAGGETGVASVSAVTGARLAPALATAVDVRCCGGRSALGLTPADPLSFVGAAARPVPHLVQRRHVADGDQPRSPRRASHRRAAGPTKSWRSSPGSAIRPTATSRSCCVRSNSCCSPGTPRTRSSGRCSPPARWRQCCSPAMPATCSTRRTWRSPTPPPRSSSTPASAGRFRVVADPNRQNPNRQTRSTHDRRG